MANARAKTVYERLAEARLEFLNAEVKKSGKNMHAEFKYFELHDIVPVATKIFTEKGLTFLITFASGIAVGRLVDVLNENDYIEVTFPMRAIAEPAKFRMNEVQALGAEITYMRRYLYMLILDIVAPDVLDSGESDAPLVEAPAKSNKPVSKAERTEIVKEITAINDNADEMQIAALKGVLGKLLDIDGSQEEFVQGIALETQGFTVISKQDCEETINIINEMLTKYEGVK